MLGGGLVNHGRTCYANACLQLLASCHAFRSAVRFIRTSNQDTKDLIDAVDELLQKKKECSICSPSTILRRFQRVAPRGFAVTETNDAQEFMLLLLDRLQRDELRRPDLKCASSSLIASCFQGQYVSQTQCGACAYNTHTLQVFNVLPLDASSSVAESLETFFSPDLINGWKCDDCGRVHPASKRCYYTWRLPHVLLLHVVRFLPTREKDTRRVSMSDTLNLAHFLASSSPAQSRLTHHPSHATYHLRAVVDHWGTGTSDGHYTCSTKTEYGTWIHTDDDTVSELPQSKGTSSKTCYILMYEKI